MTIKKRVSIMFVATMVVGLSVSAISGCKLGHKHEYTDVVTAATCKEQGYTTHTCECGDTYVDSYTEKLAHSYKDVIDVEATCTTEGKKHTACEWCQSVGEENIVVPVAAHEYVEVIDTPATCTEYGSGHKECKWCNILGETYTIDKVAHTYVDKVIEATCQQKGYTEHTCSVCGDTYVDNEVAKKDHNYVETVIVATCTEGGYTVDTCSYCKDENKRDVTPALGHDYVKTDEVPATTTQKGKITYTCTRCPASYVEETPVLPSDQHRHSWGSGSVTVKPTCTTVGTRVYSCSCGTNYTESIPATGHKYTEKKVSATCTEQGYTLHRCSSCSHEYKDQYTEKLGHDYKATVKDATCTENGLKTYTCTRDGSHAYTEVIYATGHEYSNGKCVKCGQAEPHTHTYSSTVTTPATCKNEGVRTYTCSSCGNSYTESIPKTNNHSYTHTVVSPTCTEKGYTQHACGVCGNTYNDTETSALGHNYKETNRVEPTCKNEGSVTKTCERCGDVKTEALAKTNNHNYTSEVIASTCTTGGHTKHTCSVCGSSYTDNATGALGHNYKETNRVEPTCKNEGSVTKTCERCGYAGTETLPKTDNHNYVDETVAATCTTGGYTKYTCSVCGNSYTGNETAKLGHAYSFTEEKASTCTVAGYKKWTCGRCSDSYTEALPLKDHEYINGACKDCGKEYAHEHTKDGLVSNVPETCTTDGSETWQCHCGEQFTVTIPNKGGHAWGEWSINQAASCIDGEEERTCQVCNAEETRVIPATGEHNWWDIEEIPATCTAPYSYLQECWDCGARRTEASVTVGPLGHDYKGDCARKECTRCGDVVTGHHDYVIKNSTICYGEKEWMVPAVNYGCTNPHCQASVTFYGGYESEERADYGNANGCYWYYKDIPCKSEKEVYDLYMQYGP